MCGMSSFLFTGQWDASDIFRSSIVLQSWDRATSAQHDVEDGAGEEA